MPLLILGKPGPRGHANYRGTDRESPPFAEGLPRESDYNRLVEWYWNVEFVSEEGIGLADIDRVRTLLRLLHTDVGLRHFELVEVGPVLADASVRRELLGHDLSMNRYHSLLSWGLDWSGIPSTAQLHDPIRALISLVEAHFRPLLNEHGLFSEESTARFCLRSMMAMQALSPNLWESDDYVALFRVVAVHRILEPA